MEAQVKDLATQMQSLDDYVTRAKAQNTSHHDQHLASLSTLSSTVEHSYESIGNHFTESYDRVKTLGGEMAKQTTLIKETLSPAFEALHGPLAELRQHIKNAKLRDYEPTGETPRKIEYQYPQQLPRTAPRDLLIEKMRKPSELNSISEDGDAVMSGFLSPTNGQAILDDATQSSLNSAANGTTIMVPTKSGDENEVRALIGMSSSSSADSLDLMGGLRSQSIDPPSAALHNSLLGDPPTFGHPDTLINLDNTAAAVATSYGSVNSATSTSKVELNDKEPNKNLKRPGSSASGLKQPSKLVKRSVTQPLEGKENAVPDFSRSVSGTGRTRRSPRT